MPVAACGLVTAEPRTLLAIEDIGFGHARMAVLYQDLFDCILDFLDRRMSCRGNGCLQELHDLLREALGDAAVASTHRDGGPVDRVGDALRCEGNQSSGTLDYVGDA